MKKPHHGKGRRHLDEDEAAVWDHAARTIEPLKRAKGRVHHAQDLQEEVKARPRAKAAMSEAPPDAKSAGKQAAGIAAAAATARKAVPPIVDFDRKKVKRLRSGRTEIEGRIDLHGMRQDEAHTALRSFLHRAQGKGWRWVLVITGKGKRLSEDEHEAFDMTRVRDRGVLKRNVPRWLEEPDLRLLVVSYTTAAIEHGGEGALYVHLRKRPGL